MGFKKWLKGATRIRFDDRTLGNLTKNVATGAGAVIGGPAGALIAGGGSALGSALSPGSNIGDIVKSGVRGAGTAGAIHTAGSLANKGLAKLGGGAADAATSSATGVPSVPSMAEPLVNAAGDFAPPSTGGFLSRVGDIGGKALSFAEKHPNAAGAGLTAIGNLAGNDSENRLRNAQAATLERRLGEDEYDYQRRVEREKQYADLWSPLGTAIGSGLSSNSSASNPYLPARTA